MLLFIKRCYLLDVSLLIPFVNELLMGIYVLSNFSPKLTGGFRKAIDDSDGKRYNRWQFLDPQRVLFLMTKG